MNTTIQNGADPAAHMSPAPVGFGRPCTERAAWTARAETALGRQVCAEAERAAATPLPPLDNNTYLEFSRTGSRTEWERRLWQHHHALTMWTLAECLEAHGRFIAPLQRAVRELCAARTWVMPAHDHSLCNFHGTDIGIDLRASRVAWELGQLVLLLGPVLPPELVDTIRAEVTRRVLEPFRTAVRLRGDVPAAQTTRQWWWWLDTTNNWNAVCLAGVTGAALALLTDAAQRAWFVDAARRFSASFLDGFTPDGYCSEGLGYWNYGFGHFVMLSELARRATQGAVELLASPRAAAPAHFGLRAELATHVYPAFADCDMQCNVNRGIQQYLARRFGWPEHSEDHAPLPVNAILPQCVMAWWPEDWPATPLSCASEMPREELRTWFGDAGVLISRPAPGSSARLAAAMKGGHNDEHHNHNDLGSYVLAVDGQIVLADPGREVYTRRTFSGRRYESPLLSSYGHAVPRIGGTLQTAGAAAHAHVVECCCADAADVLQLDLRAAYAVPAARTVHRTFTFARGGAGAFIVCDEIELDEPLEIETALITYLPWQQISADTVLVGASPHQVRIEVDTAGAPWRLRQDMLRAETPHGVQPTRLALCLTQPVRAARITLRMHPAP